MNKTKTLVCTKDIGTSSIDMTQSINIKFIDDKVEDMTTTINVNLPDNYKSYINTFKTTLEKEYKSKYGSYKNVKLNTKFLQYSKDIGFTPITCRIYRPQTKGKVESLAKLVDRIQVYNNEFETYEELDKIVKLFMKEINNEISQGINQKPVERLEKETKHLLPLPNQEILNAYTTLPKEYKVSKESMITYKGQKYSVPTYLIGKLVSVKETNEYIHIYYTSNLVTKHKKSKKFLNSGQ